MAVREIVCHSSDEMTKFVTACGEEPKIAFIMISFSTSVN